MIEIAVGKPKSYPFSGHFDVKRPGGELRIIVAARYVPEGIFHKGPIRWCQNESIKIRSAKLLGPESGPLDGFKGFNVWPILMPEEQGRLKKKILKLARKKLGARSS